MRRLCGRPGCSGPATATFTFDATRCVVWLNPLSDGTARAGDLCTRHADALAPPQGWERVDRRAPDLAATPATPATATRSAATATATATATRNGGNGAAASPSTTGGHADGDGDGDDRDDLLPARRRRRKRWSEVPSLFEGDGPADATADAAPAPPTDPEPAAARPSEPAWLPRFASDDDLDGVLDADTPLLARAFRNVRGLDHDDEPDGDTERANAAGDAGADRPDASDA